MNTKKPELSNETLDLLFEITRESPQKQLDAAEAMDNKLVQVFAAGSVVIGLAAVGAATKQTTTPLPAHYYTALVIATLAYLVLALATLFALWVRRFFISWGASQSWRKYWHATPRQIKHSLVSRIAEDYDENEKKLQWKRRTVRIAIFALGIESLSVGVALLILLR